MWNGTSFATAIVSAELVAGTSYATLDRDLQTVERLRLVPRHRGETVEMRRAEHSALADTLGPLTATPDTGPQRTPPTERWSRQTGQGRSATRCDPPVWRRLVRQVDRGQTSGPRFQAGRQVNRARSTPTSPLEEAAASIPSVKPATRRSASTVDKLPVTRTDVLDRMIVRSARRERSWPSPHPERARDLDLQRLVAGVGFEPTTFEL